MNATDETAAAGGDVTGELIQLDATAVANSPILGYQIGEFPAATAGEPDRRIRVPQRWIATLASPVVIDTDLFAELHPFDEILGQGATRSTPIASVSAELREHWGSPDSVIDELPSATAVRGVVVSSGALKALLWSDGMLIYTSGPVATALKLLVADFSDAARREYVRAKPTALRAALDVFAPEVKQQYLPRADTFVAQASREHAEEVHEAVQKNQQILNAKRTRVVIERTPETITPKRSKPN